MFCGERATKTNNLAKDPVFFRYFAGFRSVWILSVDRLFDCLQQLAKKAVVVVAFGEGL